MKQYKYTAININKEKYTGTFIAENERALAKELSKQGLFLVSSSVYSGGTPSAFFTMGTGKITVNEIASFCRQFSIMLVSGMSILEAIDCLRNQPYTGYFRSILAVIADDVKGGMLLSNALEKHNKVFPEFFRSMIAVGEMSGKLDKVLVSLADYYEKDQAVKKKTKSALTYPIVLSIMAVGIIVLMLTYIVPTFRNSLSSMEVEITGITKVVYNTSDFLLMYWKAILVGVIALALVIFGISQTQKGKYFGDKLALKLPIIKKVQTALITARFGRAFSLLLNSGMEIADALNAVKIVLGNRDAKARFEKAAEEVKGGAALSESFEKYNLFPQVMVQMISVGERTASLPEVLERTCSFFDEQVEDSLNKTTATLQPIILCIIGAVVAILFIAVYSPMLSIMTSVL